MLCSPGTPAHPPHGLSQATTWAHSQPGPSPSQGDSPSQSQTRWLHGVPLLALSLASLQGWGGGWRWVWLAGACSCGIREQGSSVWAGGAPEVPRGGPPHGLPAAQKPQPRTRVHQACVANPWRPALLSVLLEGQATFNSNPSPATERRAWPRQAISFL